MAPGRDVLWLTGQDESVEVNQRALIDKVLARYSGEFTVFRELLQNSDDAQSSAVEIRFETATYLHREREDGEPGNSSDVSPLLDLRSTLVAQWTFRNNGVPFRDDDWTRLRKIAEGNPDEEKIGAFGVGFYSLFSVTENPFVSSGGHGMQFYWKDNKDQLNVRRGDLPSKETADQWTTFEMTLREAGPMPPAFDFMRFLASSITFMVNINDIVVFFDKERIGHLQKSTGVAHNVVISDALKCSSPTNIMSIRAVQRHPITIKAEVMHAIYAAGTERQPSIEVVEPRRRKGDFFSPSQPPAQPENTSQAPQPPVPSEPHEMNVTLTVFTTDVDVRVDGKLSAELLRSTKKNPRSHLKYSLIYTGKDEYDQSLADEKNQPTAIGSIFRGLRADLNGATHTRIFIGHATGQTTGIGGHMASHFIPTVERESIDFADRNVAVWNKELLYVGGFLSRAAYELELSDIHTAWTSAADGTPNYRPSPKLRDRLQDRFLHTLKFFAFHHSTPSPEVGRLLETSFYGCSTAPLRMLSSVGVREASDIKEHDAVFMEFLKDIPMLPQLVIHECGHTIKTLQNQGMISPVTFSDVLHDLRQHQLNTEELVSCLRWWIGLKQDSSAINMTQLLDASVFSNNNGNTFPLSSVRYFVDCRALGDHIPQDSPLPTSLLPQDISRQFTFAELSSFGWQEFTVVHWLQYISQPDVMFVDPTHDFTRSASWAACVLSVLSHNWLSSSNDARCSVKEVFRNKACIPTSGGLYTPEGSYLPGTNNSLFRDLELPIFQLPNGSKTTEEMEALLSFIGVRKHIDPQLILNRMAETGNWNITDLIRYLVQVRNALTMEELTMLESSALFAKEGVLSDTVRHCACDLYAPIEIFRQLQLPVIQWDEKLRWRDDSYEAELLFRLGLGRYPPLEKLVDLCSSEDAAVRTAAFPYLCENLPSKYSNYNPCNFGHVAFIPAENSDGNHLGKLGEVFSGTQWKVLGFSVVQDKYRKAPISELGIHQHPPTPILLSHLEKTPPPDEDTARQWFEILFEHLSSFRQHELAVLSELPIVPTNSSGVQLWLTPTQCYLGGRTQDDFHSRLFVFVNFGPIANRFLSACGSRNEPSVKEVAESLIDNPDRFYSLSGGHENFLTELRSLAVNKHRIPNITLSKMKLRSVLLGTKAKGQQGWDYVHELRKPKEIVIADDINAYQLFRDAVFVSPQEDLLEDFYVSLGSRRLSTIVQEQCEALGEILDTKTCSDMRALVLERLTLFLHEYTHAKPKVSVAWLSDTQNFRVKICRKLFVSKTLVIGDDKTKRTQDASAGAKSDDQGRIELWLSYAAERDMYEVSTSLCRLLFGTAKVSESLLFTTILSTDLGALRRRGCNVDQILKRHQQDELTTIDDERKGHMRFMELEASKSSTSLKPHHFKQAFSSRLSLPDGFEAVPHVPTLSTSPIHSTKHNTSNPVRSMFHHLTRKVVSRVRPGSLGTAGTTVTPLQPLWTPQHVVPPSYIRANINMAIKACNPEEGQLLHHLNNMEVIKEFLNGGYCDISGQVDNLKLVGELGVSFHAKQRETVKVFATEDVPNIDTFMASMQEPLSRFVSIIMPIAEVYNLSVAFLHVFCDAGGGPIAFNREGSLFLNLRYFEAWHDQDVKNGIQQQAQISWFFTIAHEIAHNLVKPHNSEHAFWFSAICEAHISNFVQIMDPMACI